MKNLLIVILFFCAQNGWAQFAGHYNALNITGTTNTYKTEIPIAQPSWVGSSYWSEAWQPATLYLKNKSIIENMPVRLEIEHGNVEVNYNGALHFLDWNKLDQVTFSDANGVIWLVRNAHEYKVKDKTLSGIVQVLLNDSTCGIIRNYFIKIMPATYNVAVDVGSKDNRKIQKQKTYLRNNNGDWVEAPLSVKKIMRLLNVSKADQNKIRESKNYNLQRDSDLIELLQLISNHL